MKRFFLVFFVSLCLGGVLPLHAASFSYQARHDHLKGSCSGKLTIAENEISFAGPKHSFRWPYTDVQQLRLLDGKVDVLSYEDSSKWKLGADRAFHFQVVGSVQEAARFLEGKLDQRLVVGFAQPPGKVLAEFPVKHLRPMHGDSGILIFGEAAVVFRSDDKNESRTWRYRDIENIASSDRFHLSLTTNEHERAHYAMQRVFNFQLKQPISEETYNLLWRRVNKAQGLEIFEKLRSMERRRPAGPRAGSNRERPRGRRDAGAPYLNQPEVLT